MTNLINWNPFREFHHATNQLSNLVYNGGRSLADKNKSAESSLSDWIPAVNITESESEYRIDAEIPGVGREDVQVTVEHGKLTIQGDRKFKSSKENETLHRLERSEGTFLRNFRIPDDADPDSVKAGFKNGVLSVLIPKSESSKLKQIEVEIS
ncbi:Hsp20/alpha crystallin family protein [Verrucomicrobiales bacterium]|nr:Hsp20/alpha crystallin family protein [Verrucomicrobiales bacterium]MDB4737612.1 Hsp20/alpha crystallin family protein [Verrucomicrobiales bacterium]